VTLDTGAGEPRCALEALVDRFDAFIRRTASRHGLTGDEIDEVDQDLRIRIWRAAASPAGIRSTNARYVYRVAVAASLDVIRRGRTRAARALSLDQVDPSALGVPGAADQRLDAGRRHPPSGR
jgi:DNA-directed RNA polymerase specialized sigma24 family protein